jgi:hypothetical protein
MQTRTGIDIRTRLMVFELLCFTEKTVKSSLLRNIIEYCVPKKLLSSITLTGWRGNEIHTRMEILIDYDSEGSAAFTISSEAGTQLVSWSPGSTNHDPCPVWAGIIDWFMGLCSDNDLQLSWFPYFNGPARELYEKYGYSFNSGGGNSEVIDKTRECSPAAVVNTNVSSLKMKTRVSDEMFSNQTFTKEIKND